MLTIGTLSKTNSDFIWFSLELKQYTYRLQTFGVSSNVRTNEKVAPTDGFSSSCQPHLALAVTLAVSITIRRHPSSSRCTLWLPIGKFAFSISRNTARPIRHNPSSAYYIPPPTNRVIPKSFHAMSRTGPPSIAFRHLERQGCCHRDREAAVR